MLKSNKELLVKTNLLNNKYAFLQQQLREARLSVDAMKKGNIDALVISHEKALKVYTEAAADKPFRILIEKMHEGAVTLNEDGTILYCNSYFANLLHLPLQKVIGSIFENYMDDSSKALLKGFTDKASANPLKMEGYITASDRKVIPVLMNINSLSLDNMVVKSIILTDLTTQIENQEKLKRRTKQLENKNIELERTNKELAFQIGEKEKRSKELNIAKTDVKELEELNNHKEKILSTLSHDLRSPLAGIIGLAELLIENFGTFENSTVKEMLELIYKSSTDELIMLDYFVEWARIKYASEAFSPSTIELNKYVKKVFDTLTENALANKIHLNNEIEDNLIVFADGKMLVSILQNLISNSIKYTPAGGKIAVTAKRKEDKTIIEIKDTGVGMSKEKIEQLFTPQMISLSNIRKENKGAGIGLLLVKSFLEKNGGEIWVESKEGEGSSFYFTLPLMQQGDNNADLQNRVRDMA